MRIFGTIFLLILTELPGFAQEKSGDLPYPDLIPVLKNGLYGYCDKGKKVIIQPQFEWVEFFGEDLDFHDIKDPKKKIFGSADYATVWQTGQRMRIDKKGLVVYRYRQEDFNAISPKVSTNPSLPIQRFEKFQSDETMMWGVRNTNTGEVLIAAQYPVIFEELYSRFHLPQYPLILVSSPDDSRKYYVGLNGVEYRIDNGTDKPTTFLDDNFSKPELIPVLQHGLFGYCDHDLNVIIEPQFYRAEFFETDFSFQITNVNNPDIVRFGTDDYAWIETGDNKRYRIDKKGNIAYHYNKNDFKSEAVYISLNESEGFKVTGVDKTTLFQIINHSKTIDDPAFFEKTGINTLKKPLQGMQIVCHRYRKNTPFSFFRDEKTQLQGIKNRETGIIVIEPKYTMLDKLFDDMIKVNWYPLFRAFSPDVSSGFYVGLDGKEYIIE